MEFQEEKKDKKEGEGFTVVDKRKAFHEEASAEAVSATSSVDAAKPSEKAGPTADVQGPDNKSSTADLKDSDNKGANSAEDASAKSKAPNRRGAMPPPDFATFLLSIAFTAQLHLGLIANPENGKVSEDLLAAKHTIDMIDMLKQKTKGNLTSDEEKLIDGVLFELRMVFVEKNKSK